jgi:DNA-binding beta-propeller fold protein YncE
MAPRVAAQSTIYTQAPYSIIQAVSTETFQPEGLIIDGIGAGALALSSDGETFYGVAESGMGLPSQVLAIDRASGKTLRTYQTQFPIWGAVAVAPDQSKIYVATCSYSEYGITCQGGEVEVLDTKTGQSLAIVSMGGDQVFEIVPVPDGSAVCVSHGATSSPPSLLSNAVPSTSTTMIAVPSFQIGASFVAPEGGYPAALVVAPDSGSAFVLTAVLSAAVYQISLPKMTLVATIAPPPTIYTEAGSLAISPNGTLAALLGGTYASNSELLFIDVATGQVQYTVAGVVGDVVSISPDGGLAYTLDNGNLAAVDAKTGTVTPEITGEEIGSVVLSPNGKELYPLLSANTAVEVYEEGALVPSRLLEVGGPPRFLALSPDGKTLYSAGGNLGVWAVSTTTGELMAILLPGVGVGAVAVSPDGATLYAGAPNPNTVTILDAATGAVLNSVALPSCEDGPGMMAMAPGGGRLYVMVCGSTVAVDTKKQATAGMVSGTNGTGLAVSPTGRTIYVSAGEESFYDPATIDVVDAATMEITATIPISTSAIAFSPDGQQAYIGSTQDNVSGITVIDTASLAVVDFIPGVTYGAGESIAFTPDGRLAIVAGGEGSVINTRSLQVIGRFPSAELGFDAPVAIH